MFPNLKNEKIEDKKSYLGTGIHTVTIKNYKSSYDNTEYKGTPFIEFLAENENGVSFLKFTAIDEHTSEAAAKVRTQIFKRFLINCGINGFESHDEACRDAIGRKVQVCLSSREYWITDKDTNTPTIKSRVEYKFSERTGKHIAFKESYNKELSPQDKQDYEAALKLCSTDSQSTNTETPF